MSGKELKQQPRAAAAELEQQRAAAAELKQQRRDAAAEAKVQQQQQQQRTIGRYAKHLRLYGLPDHVRVSGQETLKWVVQWQTAGGADVTVHLHMNASALEPPELTVLTDDARAGQALRAFKEDLECGWCPALAPAVLIRMMLALEAGPAKCSGPKPPVQVHARCPGSGSA